jgi:hypothetical protein
MKQPTHDPAKQPTHDPVKQPTHDPMKQPTHDPVNSPAHYTQGSVEAIEAIRAALTPEEFRGFCKGNALKYSWRERHKGGDEDLKKAAWYLNKITES